MFSVDEDTLFNCLRVLTKEFTLYSIYRSNRPLSKIHGLHKLILIVLQLKNQIK